MTIHYCGFKTTTSVLNPDIDFESGPNIATAYFPGECMVHRLTCRLSKCILSGQMTRHLGEVAADFA